MANTIEQQIIEQADHNELRLYHSQPMPLNYSTIKVAKRLVGVNQMQLAMIDAVTKVKH